MPHAGTLRKIVARRERPPGGGLGRYIARRLLAVLPVLFAALTLSFAMVQLVPGDPVKTMLGAGSTGVEVTPEQEDAVRHELGLDKPLFEQYVDYLANAARGDFGASLRTGQDVLDMVGDAAPPSLELAAAALLLSVIGGAGLALGAALTRIKALRALLNLLPVLAVSAPSYWIGILAVQLFSFQLGWFPATGGGDISTLVLPAATLALPAVGIIAQVLARSLDTALAEPYTTTAYARGAGRARVLFGHALRNAAIPALTIVGTTVGSLIAGAVVVETVFARPGLGRLTVNAISGRDFPVVQGVVFLIGAVYVFVNLLVDLLYARIDPRVAATGKALPA